MVISLGQCYWPGKRVPQIPNCWSSCNVREKMRECGKGDDKGMVSDVEAMLTQGGREMLSSMRDGICDCVMVVVVALVGVLMIVVGVVVLVIVVSVSRVLCIRVVDVVGVLCIRAVEKDCT